MAWTERRENRLKEEVRSCVKSGHAGESLCGVMLLALALQSEPVNIPHGAHRPRGLADCGVLAKATARSQLERTQAANAATGGVVNRGGLVNGEKA